MLLLSLFRFLSNAHHRQDADGQVEDSRYGQEDKCRRQMKKEVHAVRRENSFNHRLYGFKARLIEVGPQGLDGEDLELVVRGPLVHEVKQQEADAREEQEGSYGVKCAHR